jgi:TP901 family phage tail tape measure protein
MARQVASLFGVLKLDDSDYKNKLQGADRDAKSFGDTLKSQGQQMQNFGAGMTAFFAPVGLAMGYAVTQGHTFDRTMSNINSIMKLGAEDAAALRAEILAFGSSTVAGPQATAEAYYDIVSGVADATTHMAILEAATKTAEAGQADLGATTSALISTMNAYGFAASDAAFVSDVFTRTVGMGVGSMDEFAAAFPQVMGLAAPLGISLDAIGSSMAYLTTQGYSAAQSGTFMKAMITTLLSPTADLQAAITALGYESGAALIQAEGLTGAYSLLSQQNGGLDGLITNTEALQGAMALTNEGAGEFFNTYNEGLAGSTDTALAIQNQTAQWEHLQSQLSGLAIQISDALMPTLMNLVTNYLSPLITTVSDWMLKNPELTTQIALLVGGLVIAGPVIAGVGTVLTLLGGAVGLVTGAFGLLSGAVAILTSPAIVLVGIFMGLIFLFNRPGGIIQSLKDAHATTEMLATIAFTALSKALENGLKLWNQLNTIIGLVFGHEPPWWWGAQMSSSTTSQIQALAGDNSINGYGQIGGAPRAGGGDVEAGRQYTVGENGPEQFVPRVSGTIVPNHAAGQGGNTFNVTIHANSEEEGRAAARGFSEDIPELMRSKGIAWANG